MSQRATSVRGPTFGDESSFVRHLGPYAVIWDLPTERFTPGTGFMYSHPGGTVLVECPPNARCARAFPAFVHPAPGSANRHDTDEIFRAAIGHRSGAIEPGFHSV
ncbi:hypothetical protein [Candidatus Mycobacterium methanotrophicum]|uniref:Uncharacterized protein n=1 Tax=Candidatus Mycobacterium methanotrophicum TaxID=2943498 RepID=A0ABY4QL99_9MYCO|nr:hypothetical protein [Candidatus Mycobacterium methanotrophicum]UQX11639.1 hypothetical protein M5I08_04005 [Candidatus Mycobacterium methanotrophicum]